MNPKDPQSQARERELDHLYTLQELPAFHTYLKLLQVGIDASVLQLAQTRASAEDMANHNYLIGFIEGTKRAHALVSTIIQQAESPHTPKPKEHPNGRPT